jgi:hypothetical protein
MMSKTQLLNAIKKKSSEQNNKETAAPSVLSVKGNN